MGDELAAGGNNNASLISVDGPAGASNAACRGVLKRMKSISLDVDGLIQQLLSVKGTSDALLRCAFVMIVEDA